MYRHFYGDLNCRDRFELQGQNKHQCVQQRVHLQGSKRRKEGNMQEGDIGGHFSWSKNAPKPNNHPFICAGPNFPVLPLGPSEGRDTTNSPLAIHQQHCLVPF